ncbi:MAG: efflux RND transporter periplasmic adaptor subunit [Ignavibacteriaceae bacterium]|jgi:membrane fusion protein (multidrug efflux system)|nr:efflux RND transporter periplasmic adaptor subunit [Ignavibacteriaceae bacterium]
MNNKKRIITWSAVALIIIVLILPKIKFSNDKEAKTDSPGSPKRKTVVNAIIVKTKFIQDKIFSNGTFISNEEVELRSEISGKITKILFKEGQPIKKGTVLIKINDSELQATLKKNQSKESLARDKEYRIKQLFTKNLTSQQEYDNALSELNSAEADVEFTKAQLEKTEIRAPFDGIIGLRSVSEGSYISPTSKIATLQNINPVKVDFSVPQKYFGIVKEGKTILVKIASTGKTYSGKIYAVEPKIDESSRTVQARAIIPNDRRELTPGAYVEIDIVLQDIKDAIMVPSEAVVPDIQGEKVFVYRNGIAVPQLVKQNIRTENEVQIIDGLNVGDTIIVSGIIQLKPNAPVKLNAIN